MGQGEEYGLGASFQKIPRLTRRLGLRFNASFHIFALRMLLSSAPSFFDVPSAVSSVRKVIILSHLSVMF